VLRVAEQAVTMYGLGVITTCLVIILAEYGTQVSGCFCLRKGRRPRSAEQALFGSSTLLGRRGQRPAGAAASLPFLSPRIFRQTVAFVILVLILVFAAHTSPVVNDV